MHDRTLTAPATLGSLNEIATDGFVHALDGVFEHAPWVAARAAQKRPFTTVADLHRALMDAVSHAPEPELIGFLNAHPELALDKLPRDLTVDSAAEQTGLGMHQAAGAEALPALNQQYRTRFGFPFIVCVARHTAENVLRTLRLRLVRAPAEERQTALDEIARITLLRLVKVVSGPGAPPVAGHLSVHALDTQTGRPAAGLAATLLQEGRAVAHATTDADGRIGAGLLPPGPVRQGRYELVFDVGGYFAGRVEAFYDTIPIRFVVASAEARTHVPLLLAPFGYSTYRGS